MFSIGLASDTEQRRREYQPRAAAGEGFFNYYPSDAAAESTHSRATRFVSDGRFPWNPGRRATLAEVRQIGDVVLLRYALSDRFEAADQRPTVARVSP